MASVSSCVRRERKQRLLQHELTEDDALRATVVGRSEGAEALLPCRVL